MKLGKLSLATATATLAAGAAALGAAPAGATPMGAKPMGAKPMGATAFTGAMIGPKKGGTLSGFGITVSFAKGAVQSARYIILGNWPNGLDVTPPSGQRVVKTFGLQECAPNPQHDGPLSGTCTSEFGNYSNSPSGTEWIKGMTIGYMAGQTLSPNTDLQGGDVNFGSLTNKKVTITVATGGSNVYIYNPNPNAKTAYPTELPSTSANGVLTFQTFQPIVWTVTSPMA